MLSPAVIVNDQKIAINVIDLRSAERRQLAVHNPTANYPLEFYWRFDADALAWGNEVLLHRTPCDVLLVDELGVLEFERNQGWVAGLAAIESGAYRLGLVVIRPELLQAAQQRWPWARVLTIETVDQARTDADRLWPEISVD